eukprot:3370447-Alexandrium_andersonii.AAC.1
MQSRFRHSELERHGPRHCLRMGSRNFRGILHLGYRCCFEYADETGIEIAKPQIPLHDPSICNPRNPR